MCGYCCGGVPVERRGEGHRGCSEECYNAPRKRPRTADREREAAALDEAADDLHDLTRIGETLYADLGDGELERFRTHPLGDALGRIDGPESWEVRSIAEQWLRGRAAALRAEDTP